MRDKVRTVLRSGMFRATAVLFVVFCIVLYFCGSQALLGQMDGISIVIAIGLLVAYGPIAFVALRTAKPDNGGILATGIFFGWLSFIVLRILSLFVVTASHYSLLSIDSVSFAVFIAAIGGVFHLIAVDAVDGWLPSKVWVRIVAMGVTGIILGLLWRHRVT